MSTTDATSAPTEPTAAAAPTASLFERIGGRAGLERIVPDVLALHLVNPVCGARFRAATTPIDELTRHAVEFFATGLSGEVTYTGRSMEDAHAGMQVTEAEYLAVLDDILAALEQHGIAERERAELLYIAYGMKSMIIAH